MKRKIINDPVFGFINIPNEFIFDIIQHPYFQRLSRIKQLGLSYIVYPGATHTRMLHSLGAMHLMGEAIAQLRIVGHIISKEEENAAKACMLLHDIGHAPFSHTLESSIIKGISHEEISLAMMQEINLSMKGKLSMTLDIFTNQYHKHFLHQLVSSQLDMDRLDYLSRDSFFCGVSEGIIGASRIIKMLNVHNDKLVVEAKGVYSIEKFLVARRLMYWQVYLHKTSVAAEKMLINIIKRAKKLIHKGEELFTTPTLGYFLKQEITKKDFETANQLILQQFAEFDDTDILSAIKVWQYHPDKVLSKLSYNFTNRKLFKSIIFETEEKLQKAKEEIRHKISKKLQLTTQEANYFIGEETVYTDTYNSTDDTIEILYKDGTTKDIAEASDMLNIQVLTKKVTKKYLFYQQL